MNTRYRIQGNRAQLLIRMPACTKRHFFAQKYLFSRQYKEKFKYCTTLRLLKMNKTPALYYRGNGINQDFSFGNFHIKQWGSFLNYVKKWG